MLFFFFFSSRRRHTRFDCDWSSDVCSSDLKADFRAKLQRRRRKLQALGPLALRSFVRAHPEVLQRFYDRSEEHTSELQSQSNLVCRLLLEKKKNEENPAYLAHALKQWCNCL